MLALLLAAAVQALPQVSVPPGASPPKLVNMREVFSAADYPVAELRANQQGVADLQISVDSAGRPTACTIQASSGSASLDSTSCRLIVARGRFSPARDSRGQAIAGQLRQRVTWAIPEPDVEIEPLSFSIRLTYPLKDGIPTGPCRGEVVPGGGGDELCEQTRTTAQELANAIPAKDRPGAKSLVMTIERQLDTSAEPAPLAGIGGLVIIDDRFARLTVDSSGKVVNCIAGGATLARTGGAASFCARFTDNRYAADPKAPTRKLLFRSQAFARK